MPFVSRLHRAASWYAEHGIPVFPLVQGMKKPATRNGFKDATTERHRIDLWYTEWCHNFNIGAPTGVVFDILDVDSSDGALIIEQIKQRGLLPRVYGVATTPKNSRLGGMVGYHYYIRPTGNGRAAGEGAISPGLEGLGTDGYAVLPPSIITKPEDKAGQYKFVEMLDLEGLRA